MRYLVISALVVVTVAILFLFSKNWKRTVQIVTGWGFYGVLCWIYDNPFWLVVLNYFGTITGSIILTVGAFILNFSVLCWYQKKGTDWLGVGILEEVKENGHNWAEKLCHHNCWFVRLPAYLPAKFFQLLIWALNKNDVMAFFMLSVLKDSFVTTAFLRHGRFGKLEKKDIAVFVLSTLVSCLAWSAWMVVVLQMIKTVWRAVVGV